MTWDQKKMIIFLISKSLLLIFRNKKDINTIGKKQEPDKKQP